MKNLGDDIVELLNFIRPNKSKIQRDKIFTSDKNHSMNFKPGGIEYLKKMANDFGGYLTVIKTSSEYDYGEAIFTVDKVRLMISEKIKQSFDPKRILNPGKMYRGI